jgi:adenosylhomocysteine nucleosidase
VQFDTIVVPRGAEARALIGGWPTPRPDVLVVPAGAAAGRSVADGPPLGRVLVIGLCGALDPMLAVGDAVVYNRIAASPAATALDASLSSACAEALGRPLVTAATVDHVVGDVAGKDAVRASTGAAVIDMEAAPLAAALAGRGARIVMVRIVSDAAQTELPDLRGVYTPEGALRPLRLTAALLRSPIRGTSFVRNALHALQSLQAAATALAQESR